MTFLTPATDDRTVLANPFTRPAWEAAFDYRPELLDAWTVLLACIKVRMQPVRFELATLAAAMAIKSSYCALAHGSVLRDFFTDDQILGILADGPPDELSRAIMEFAAQIAGEAWSIDERPVMRLRAAGLTEGEICDIAAAAAARCFFAKYIDALGIQPDAHYSSLPEALRIALTPGRPIAG